jgi:CRP/FNR family transcriptional regulator, cyclic AMP receptor protein
VAASTRETVALLERVPLFAGCSRRELEAVAGALKEVRHREGHVIAKEGDTGIGFFVIAEGTAAVSIGGRPRTKLGPGDFFGEISLLDHGPRTATVTASSPIRLLGLTAWAFRGLVQQHPKIALNMLKVVAARVRNAAKPVTS